MNRIFIKEIPDGAEGVIRGWVEHIGQIQSRVAVTVRDASGRGTFVMDAANCAVGDYIEFSGVFSGKDSCWEVRNCSAAVLVSFPQDKRGLLTENDLSADALRYRYLTIRSERYQSNLEIVNRTYAVVVNWMRDHYFKYVETPVLTKTIYEYTHNDFIVKSPQWDDDEYAHLVQSPQIYKQMLMCGGVERYYQLAKNFRAEKSDRTHLQEFTQLCAELYTSSEREVMDVMEALICEIFQQVIGVALPRPFRVTTESAHPDEYADKMDVRWVVGQKMAKIKNGRIVPIHHVVAMPKPECIPSLESMEDLLNAESTGFDLEINGVELASGNLRICDAELQRKILRIQGYTDEEILRYYGPLMRMLESGVPQHGGFAFGLSRICMMLANESDIRNIIAFPTDEKGKSSMMDFPIREA